MICRVLQGGRLRGREERLERVHHHRKLLRPLGPDACLVRAGMGTMRDAGGMEREGAGPDSAAAREVAAQVEDEFIAVDARMRIRAGDGVGMGVRHAGDERADEEARARERRMNGRRQVHEARLRLVLLDVEGPRIDETIPADDVHRRTLELVTRVDPAFFTRSSRGPSCTRSGVAMGPRGRTEVAVRVGRVHPELPHRVAELVGDDDPVCASKHIVRSALASTCQRCIERPWHPDVVARRHVEPAAQRLEPRRPLLPRTRARRRRRSRSKRRRSPWGARGAR